ncbi:hypothetical protein FAZ15_18345 [Sphingobacterium olei]|uniref:Uncharacterized protein n=1 Tax=Sphingobacterium olei TaxID=2571155 RepID=A0A4U0NGV1_9SPHI|nr:hypothetical protein [Sphingobacterium olei]TJZ53310.1 hypothetical protein FAZ15_18345 [Sphingobacterium olei]
MIYSKQELEGFVGEGKEREVAVSRYLSKIIKNEVKKIFPHELEFITRILPHISKEKYVYKPLYNIYELDYCSESLFKLLILRYLFNLDFLQPVFTGTTYLKREEIDRDKEKFHVLFADWERKLNDKPSNDVFLHEVKKEYFRKIKHLDDEFKQNIYTGRFCYDRKIVKHVNRQ